VLKIVSERQSCCVLLDFMAFADGADGLSQNFSKEIPLSAV